jgi:hypothetical protein
MTLTDKIKALTNSKESKLLDFLKVKKKLRLLTYSQNTEIQFGQTLTRTTE